MSVPDAITGVRESLGPSSLPWIERLWRRFYTRPHDNGGRSSHMPMEPRYTPYNLTHHAAGFISGER